MFLFCLVFAITLASNLGYLAPPGQFFMGAKLFIGTPWMGNEGVLKKKIISHSEGPTEQFGMNLKGPRSAG